MTSTTLAPAAPATGTAPASTTVSTRRRIAVGAAAFLASALPLVWGTGAAVMLATGVEADHRFHQVTGQGLLLAAVWLGGLLPLARAGMRGRRPSTASALQLLAFLVAAVVATALAPGNGAVAVAVIALSTSALLWAVLPVKPRLRGAFGGLDVALAPVALLMAALVTPFALGDAELQRGMVDEHAEMSHYFDMAWITLACVGLSVLGALSACARRLAVWGTTGLLVTGASRMVFTDDVTWSVLAMVLGGAGLVLAVLRERAEKAA